MPIKLVYIEVGGVQEVSLGASSRRLKTEAAGKRISFPSLTSQSGLATKYHYPVVLCAKSKRRASIKETTALEAIHGVTRDCMSIDCRCEKSCCSQVFLVSSRPTRPILADARAERRRIPLKRRDRDDDSGGTPVLPPYPPTLPGSVLPRPLPSTPTLPRTTPERLQLRTLTSHLLNPWVSGLVFVVDRVFSLYSRPLRFLLFDVCSRHRSGCCIPPFPIPAPSDELVFEVRLLLHRQSCP